MRVAPTRLVLSLRKTRDTIEELLRCETAITQALQVFMELGGDSDLCRMIGDLHDERTAQTSHLRQLLFTLRCAEPSTNPHGAPLGNGGLGVARALGSRERLSVLRYDIERTVAAYEAALDNEDVVDSVKQEIRTTLLPQALDHAARLRRYLAATWGPRAVPSAPAWGSRAASAPSWSDRSGVSWERRLALAGLPRH